MGDEMKSEQNLGQHRCTSQIGGFHDGKKNLVAPASLTDPPPRPVRPVTWSGPGPGQGPCPRLGPGPGPGLGPGP